MYLDTMSVYVVSYASDFVFYQWSGRRCFPSVSIPEERYCGFEESDEFLPKSSISEKGRYSSGSTVFNFVSLCKKQVPIHAARRPLLLFG